MQTPKSDEEIDLTTEKLKLYFDLVKFLSASVVVTLITFWINSGFKDREIAIKEQEYLAQFKADALNKDIEHRRRLAEYFAKVTIGNDARERWHEYLQLIELKISERQESERQIQELNAQLAKANTGKEEIQAKLDETTRAAERLRRELAPQQITHRGVVPPVYFPSGTAEIPASWVSEVRHILARFSDKLNLRLRVIGHTDTEPLSPEAARRYINNLGLSEFRAREVATFVAEALDLDPAQIEVLGRGSTNPVASNASPEGVTLNNRVEIDLLFDE